MLTRTVSSFWEACHLAESLDRRLGNLLVLFGALSTAAVAFAFRDNPLTSSSLGAMVAVCVWLSAIDLAVHRLPNIIVVPLGGSVFVSLVIGGVVGGDIRQAMMSIGVGLLLSAVFFLGHSIGVIGMGDVKYAFPLFATVAWFGVLSFQVMIMTMTISATGTMIVSSIRNRSALVRIAYGPHMTLGLIAALLAIAF